MKWKNKGRELEKKAGNIVKGFEKRKKIHIFGAGFLGKEIQIVLEKYGIFAGYIDNDTDKQKKGCNGANVISFQDYIRKDKQTWIVVAASEKNTNDICKQLEDEGLTRGKDYFLHQQFMNEIFPVVSFCYYNKLFVELAQICLTERCTLKCRKCAHGCFNISNEAEDPSIDSVKESADIFFLRFDLIKEFVLIGGEPFLYKDIKEAITYIGENYRDRIITFAITTNGTILPDDETIQLCMKYDVTLRVSDYSDSLPWLKPQYNRLYKKIARNKMSVWKTNNEESWFDYGFEDFVRGNTADELTDAFDKCRTPCREVRGSKYYYCVMARSVAENLGLGIGEQDYLDLKETSNRNVLLEFQMGFSDKGYLDMCRFCRGAEAKDYLIPAAEQKHELEGDQL